MPYFEKGDRVEVIHTNSSRKHLVGEFGTVVSLFKRESMYYGVNLDKHTNILSEKGLYWFCATDLNKLSEEESNESEEIIMFDNFNVAEVHFLDNPNSGTYAYALYDINARVGDIAVVKTAHHGFSIAEIVSISINTDEDSKKGVKKSGREIVCLADFSVYYARKDTEKRAKKLKSDMGKRIREAQELALYEALAEKDPTLKAMLEEYKAIMGSCK